MKQELADKLLDQAVMAERDASKTGKADARYYREAAEALRSLEKEIRQLRRQLNQLRGDEPEPCP